ncbi:uncharacterized protein LOC144541950 [Centroberyx gerrardi]
MEDKPKSELLIKLRRANHRLKELKRENARLRQCLSVIEELPFLLQEVKDLRKARLPKEKSQFSATEKPLPSTVTPTQPNPATTANKDAMVELAKGTVIKEKLLSRLSKSPKKIVLEMMADLFSREEMASSSLSGKQTNAHKHKEAKSQLCPTKVKAICEYMRRTHAMDERETKRIIRTKLNNEAKLFRK